MAGKSKIPNFIQNDFWRKFIALTFAFLAWYYVSSKVNKKTVYRNIPVKIIPSDPKQIIGDSSMVSLSLRGSERKLQMLHSSDIRIEVTLPKNIRAGLNQIPFSEENVLIGSLNGLELHKVLDKTVNVTVDIIEEKTVPVKIIYKNEMSSHLTLSEEPQPEPKNVRIVGPSRRLKDIDRIYTDTVLFDSKRSRSFTTPATMIAPSEIKFLDDYNKVTVKVPLTEVKRLRQITGIPVRIMFLGASGRNSLVIDEKLDILISGPPDKIKKLKPEQDIQLFVLVDEQDFKAEYPVKFWCRYSDIAIEGSFSRTVSLGTGIEGQ